MAGVYQPCSTNQKKSFSRNIQSEQAKMFTDIFTRSRFCSTRLNHRKMDGNIRIFKYHYIFLIPQIYIQKIKEIIIQNSFYSGNFVTLKC